MSVRPFVRLLPMFRKQMIRFCWKLVQNGARCCGMKRSSFGITSQRSTQGETPPPKLGLEMWPRHHSRPARSSRFSKARYTLATKSNVEATFDKKSIPVTKSTVADTFDFVADLSPVLATNRRQLEYLQVTWWSRRSDVISIQWQTKMWFGRQFRQRQ